MATTPIRYFPRLVSQYKMIIRIERRLCGKRLSDYTRPDTSDSVCAHAHIAGTPRGQTNAKPFNSLIVCVTP